MIAATHLHTGVYSLAEASRIVGVTANTLRRWGDPQQGVVKRRFQSDEGTVSFLEMMELLFVQMFRREGVSLPAIRKAADTAAQKFATEYPFSVKRFDTDGKTIFATLLRQHDDEELLEDLRHGQYVFKEIVRPFFKNLEYGDQEAMRYWPLGTNGRVVLDPQRRWGQPIDAPTGVPTRSLYDAVLAGGGQEEQSVARWFDVPVKAVTQAVKFEKSIA